MDKKNLVKKEIKEIDLNDVLNGTPSLVDLIERFVSIYEKMVADGYKDIWYEYNLDYTNYITFYGYREETDHEMEERVNKILAEHDKEYQQFLKMKAKFEPNGG